ncbi:hypothetical protein [Streptomyces sp. NEAU-H3]|nr:hypothetical protein [Streptomyces sp. NEAU-H3]NJA56696.1 hypothetical protein [Streptomyces sp. NEAU-H3]
MCDCGTCCAQCGHYDDCTSIPTLTDQLDDGPEASTLADDFADHYDLYR